eukprot:scaffold175055_cov21-Tisochrysis_lutea.AAC.2
MKRSHEHDRCAFSGHPGKAVDRKQTGWIRQLRPFTSSYAVTVLCRELGLRGSTSLTLDSKFK